MADPKNGDLRVWWIPQVPMTPFYMPVHSVVNGVRLMIVLADYDKFQFDNQIKPDYANVGGVQVYDERLAADGDGGVEGLTDLSKSDCLAIIAESLDPLSHMYPDHENS